MMSRTGRRNSDTQGTRELILDEAERLIARKGLDALALKDIAEPLRIRVPSIYAHFKSRADILTAVAGRYVTALARQFPDDGVTDPEKVLLGGVRGLVIYFASNPAHVRLKLRDLETPGGRPELSVAAEGEASANLEHGPVQVLFERLGGLLKRGHAAGRFREVDVVTFYRVVFGTTLVSLTWPTQDIFTSSSHSQEVSHIMPMIEDVARRLVHP